jgi:hypothetical protein
MAKSYPQTLLPYSFDTKLLTLPVTGAHHGAGLKDRFIELARHVSIDPAGGRLYSLSLPSTRSGIRNAMSIALGLQPNVKAGLQEALQTVGLRNLAQRIIALPPPGEDWDFFKNSLHQVSLLAFDMQTYSDAFNPFTYLPPSKSDSERVSPVLTDYAVPGGRVVQVTDYSFFCTLLENLDFFEKALRSPKEFERERSDMAPDVARYVESNFGGAKARVDMLYKMASQALNKALSHAHERGNYSKDSFLRWVKDPRTSKEALARFLEHMVSLDPKGSTFDPFEQRPFSYKTFYEEGFWGQQ